MNRRSLILGTALASVFAASAHSAYLPSLPAMLNALDNGVKGDGVANDSVAIQAFLTAAAAQSAVAWFPGGGKIYNMGGGSAAVPDGANVLCQSDAIFRRTADTTVAPNPTVAYGTYTSAMLSLGSHCRWTGGVLQNTAVFTTSATSINIGGLTPGGSVSVTIGLNLNILVGFSDFRFWSAAGPVNRFEGFITAYNPATGVATMSGLFTGGTGTHADWNVTFGGVFQCPMVLHNVTETVVENVRMTGFWYVGLIMEAWNASGAALLTSNCTFRNCWAESVQNRPYYLYGNCSDNIIADCWVLGGTGVSDYGVNFNTANVGTGVNSIARNVVSNLKAIGTYGQGIAFGAACIENTAVGCEIAGVVGPSGVGYLVESVFNGTSNQNAQFNKFVGCSAFNCVAQGFAFIGTNQGGAWSCTALVCGTAFLVSPTGDVTPIQCSGVTINACEGLSSTATNFTVLGNSSEIDLTDVKSSGGVTGIVIGAGAVNTLITGRSSNNTTNLSDSGTGTVHTGLITV